MICTCAGWFYGVDGGFRFDEIPPRVLVSGLLGGEKADALNWDSLDDVQYILRTWFSNDARMNNDDDKRFWLRLLLLLAFWQIKLTRGIGAELTS